MRDVKNSKKAVSRATVNQVAVMPSFCLNAIHAHTLAVRRVLTLRPQLGLILILHQRACPHSHADTALDLDLDLDPDPDLTTCSGTHLRTTTLSSRAGALILTLMTQSAVFALARSRSRRAPRTPPAASVEAFWISISTLPCTSSLLYFTSTPTDWPAQMLKDAPLPPRRISCTRASSSAPSFVVQGAYPLNVWHCYSAALKRGAGFPRIPSSGATASILCCLIPSHTDANADHGHLETGNPTVRVVLPVPLPCLDLEPAPRSHAGPARLQAGAPDIQRLTDVVDTVRLCHLQSEVSPAHARSRFRCAWYRSYPHACACSRLRGSTCAMPASSRSRRFDLRSLGGNRAMWCPHPSLDQQASRRTRSGSFRPSPRAKDGSFAATRCNCPRLCRWYAGGEFTFWPMSVLHGFNLGTGMFAPRIPSGSGVRGNGVCVTYFFTFILARYDPAFHVPPPHQALDLQQYTLSALVLSLYLLGYFTLYFES
ncbi:hypothetical protein C8R44DRAFT_985719 [Mycena epipterygia]|nr:hypothetical protein C8R44DRAFT_985719 [Mycena epipterygia]